MLFIIDSNCKISEIRAIKKTLPKEAPQDLLTYFKKILPSVPFDRHREFPDKNLCQENDDYL